MDVCLSVPISFVRQTSNKTACQETHVQGRPSSIASWGFSTLDEKDVGTVPSAGAVIGFEDGSMLLFHADTISARQDTVHVPPAALKDTSSKADDSSRYPHHLSKSRSRPQSPTSGSSKMNLAPVPSSKARAVSGVSKEQVEAPKNYVDFDVEEEKLKEILGDRVVKDRSAGDLVKAPFEKRVGHQRPSSINSNAKSNDFDGSGLEDTRSIASARSFTSAQTRAATPAPSPPPPATKRKKLSAKCRILPRHCGSGHQTSAITILEKGKFFVTLQVSGIVSVYKSLDGVCLASAETGEELPVLVKETLVSNASGSQILWSWKSLHVTTVDQASLLIAIAGTDILPSAHDPDSDVMIRSRVCVFELSSLNEHEYGETRLDKVGDIVLDARAELVGVVQSVQDVIVYHLNADSHLYFQTIHIRPSSSVTVVEDDHRQHHSVSISSLSHPLLAFANRAEPTTEIRESAGNDSRLSVISNTDVGELSGRVDGLRVGCFVPGLFTGTWWNSSELNLFSYELGILSIRSKISAVAIKDVALVDEVLLNLVFADRVETYVTHDVAIEGASQSDGNLPAISRTDMVVSSPLNPWDLFCLSEDKSRIVSSGLNKSKQRLLEIQEVSQARRSKASSKVAWISGTNYDPNANAPYITSMLPIELQDIILGYSNGQVGRLSLLDLLKSTEPIALPDNAGFDAAILSLHQVDIQSTMGNILVGGGDDGSINIWDFSSLMLRARWIVFTDLLRNVTYLGDEAVGRLQRCLLCCSEDGSIAVIATELASSSFELLYLIPGSPAQLLTLNINEDNLLLLYSDGRSRLWNTKTREFWRSMTSEKAAEMLAHDEWFSSDLNKQETTKSALLALNKSTASGEPPPTLMIDIAALIDKFNREFASSRTVRTSAEDLKAVLAVILRPGLEDANDRLISDFFAVSGSSAVVGSYDSYFNYQITCSCTAHGIWQVSPEVTAVRLLSAISLLRVFMNLRDLEAPSNKLSSFYTKDLPTHVGSSYQAPSLPFIAYHWTESTVAEIRMGAKVLFEGEVGRLSDEAIINIVEKWQQRLPSYLPITEKQTQRAALALSVCGNVAVERYNVLSATTLSDIATSISAYLYDESSPYRSLAIDLCSRGFDIWQHYFDAMEALRSLFTLATTSRKESISLRNLGPQARLAILQIASSNSPLFITTLSMDILHPRSIEYSKSVMQVIAFLIRKKPLVLYPSLPRLLEAVVKSLDPGNTTGREAVIDAVTEILGFVVRNFPTVDFHVGVQRLAVGTSEGAVIMYDLKTATRLYVLEGHRHRLSGISFSPDGRRLVTLSLDESVVLVWKVGSSFTSLFHPGAPPRQGHGGSDPYKTISFKTGNDTKLSLEDTLAQVKFEWPADRSVKVKIQETILTFNT